MKTKPPLLTTLHRQPAHKGIRFGCMLTALMLCALPLSAHANIVINEVMASNGETLSDEDGDYPDWIELYNTGDDAVNLEGWGLSDDSDDPFQWTFPDSVLEPGQFLVVFASNKDRVLETENLTRDPDTEELEAWTAHEDLALSEDVPAASDGATSLRVTDPGTEGREYYESNLYSVTPNDTLRLGQTYTLGFWAKTDTEGFPVRVIAGMNEDPWHSYHQADIQLNTDWSYYSYTFTYEPTIDYGGPHRLPAFGLGMNTVAGANAYFHGVTLFEGMSARPMTETTGQEAVYHTNFAINSSGEDVLLTRSDEAYQDTLSETEIPRDISYGRKPDRDDEWGYFVEPTPGKRNPRDAYAGFLEPPSFSHEPGFHDSAFDLVIENAASGATIRYTLDGSTPDEDSPEYTGPLPMKSREGESNTYSAIPTTPPGETHMPWREPDGEVFKGNIVRARVFEEDYVPSASTDATYFVGQDVHKRYTFPVFSVITDPGNLFSDERGIYVPGDAYENVYPDDTSRNPGNYKQRGAEWERPVSLEMFESDGSVAMARDAGLRIHGSISRSYAQKSLRLYARASHGETHFQHSLFAGQEPHRHRRFILRNGGQGAIFNNIRDIVMHSLIEEWADLDTQAYRPSIVFVNGEYWGIHTIRERYDKYYFATHYGVDPENIDLLTHRGDQEVQEGDVAHYEAMVEFLESEDITEPENYAHLQTLMDIDNFIDYQVAQIYVDNTDWPATNMDYWRYRTDEYEPDAPEGHDGRWRWLIVDLDHGFGLFGDQAHQQNTLKYATSEMERFSNLNPPWATFLFRTLLENEEFQYAFINRFADIMNTVFDPDYAVNRINALERVYAPEIDEHIARWRYPRRGREEWDAQLEVMREFARKRPAAMREHIASYFDLDGVAEVRVNPDHPRGGSVRIHRTELEAKDTPWTGTYFQGIPVEVEAKPAPGYRFSGWSGDAPGNVDGATLTLDLSGDVELEPEFERIEGYGEGFVPTAHDLSEDPYVFSAWPSDSERGTYPDNILFMRNVVEDPDAARDPELDAPLEEPWTHPYGLDNRSRVVGLGEDGFGFINTTWFQGYRHDEPWDEDHQGYLGGAVLALNTEGVDSAEVTWEAGTVEPNDREYALRLRYRVGNEGAFSDVLDEDGNPVEYARGSEAGDTQVLGPVELPEEMLDHPYVQLKWRYHYIDTGVEGQRAKLRVGGITVNTEEQALTQELAFDGLHHAGQADNKLIPFEVEALDGDGRRDITYSGPVTVELAEGPGELDGTLTADAVNGVARFDDLTVSEPGAYRLEATAPELAPAVSEELHAAALEEILIPRYMQADPPHPNNDRVPYAFRLRLSGLVPDTEYRYANRIATVDEEPTQDGAGNNIFVDPANFRRNTDTPDFGGDPGAFSTFETDSAGTYEGWFITEPTGNDRFDEDELRLRILLNDGAGGEENHFFLTTPSTAELRSFGQEADEATGLYADSPSEPRNFVFLYDNVDGEGRPIAGTFVEPGGQDIDGRYTTFYEDEVWDEAGRWGTLLPNDLAEGVRRIEERDVADGSVARVLTSEDGQWDGVDTRNPSGGATAPIVLALEEDPGNPGDPAFQLLDFTPKAGLTMGSTLVQAVVDGLTEDTQLQVGGTAAPRVEIAGDVFTGQLPSLMPGEYSVRVLDEEADFSDTHPDPMVITDDPFEAGALDAMDAVEKLRQEPSGATLYAGPFPKEDGALRDLDFETEEGIRIHVPVAALPPDTENAFLVVRSAEKLTNVHDADLKLPEQATPRRPAADIHVLVETDDASFELNETFDAPGRLAFPAPGEPLDRLFLGGMDTNLDERFEPILPDEPAVTDYDVPLAFIDGEEYVEAEVASFTTYALLGSRVAGDVNNDGVVNAQDIQIVINAVLGLPLPEGVTEDDTDITGSGETNAQDIQSVINKVLAIE
ncbi:MAG: CotH kinase family protein [Candidatus Hydrogenedentota bacterium]